jgi:uracil-DNA glycosylase
VRESAAMLPLAGLYKEIHDCRVCPNMTPPEAVRRADAVTLETDTFVISQAPAEGYVRRSGVNFFDANGRLGGTGRNLERFLNQFGRTVHPYRDIKLSSGCIVPAARDGFLPVYNTDTVQCFPGKKSSGEDRAPSGREISNCIAQGYIAKELKTIRPKLLLLMGDKSRRSFYKHFIGTPRRDTLSEHIAAIVSRGEFPAVDVDDLRISVMPIQHASGANPNFHRMLRNRPLIDMIRATLSLQGTKPCQE